MKTKKFLYQKYSYLQFLINNLKSLSDAVLSIKSYSDFGEDLILTNLTQGQKVTYLDIGSGHPIIGSNTYFFYKSGFSGITVEPIKFHNFLHKLIRRRDIQINKILSNVKNKVNFYEFNPTQYSTISTIQYKELISRGMEARRIYKVSSISVNEVIDLLPDLPAFISIDCEGYDLEILRQIDPERLKKVFAIIIERPQDYKTCHEVFKIMKNTKFELMHESNNNLVYCKKILI